jgi:hypothetical protein
MSVRAYPIEYKEDKNGRMWSSPIREPSINLWRTTVEEEKFLELISFYDSLNQDCCGQTEINMEFFDEIIDELEDEYKTEEVKELIEQIKKDFKNYGDGYSFVQYAVF